MKDLKRPTVLIIMKSKAKLRPQPKIKAASSATCLCRYLSACRFNYNFSVLSRDTLDLRIVRQRATIYASMPDRSLANLFDIRVISRSVQIKDGIYQCSYDL